MSMHDPLYNAGFKDGSNAGYNLAKADMAADVLDAERYRWLREKDNFPGDEGDGPSLWDQLCEMDMAEFDAFVDLLRATPPPQPGQEA